MKYVPANLATTPVHAKPKWTCAAAHEVANENVEVDDADVVATKPVK